MSKKILQRIGIYCIRNMIDGKCYVGQSARLDKRKKEHFVALLKGNHHCIYLQRAFNKHGKEFFEHIILEECTIENMINREQFWMDHFTNTVGIYNHAPSAGSPLGIKRSPESVEKVAASKRGKKLSAETRKKMSVSAKNNSAAQSIRFKAQWNDPNGKLKLAACSKGRIASDETKAKLSAGLFERWANPEYKERVTKSSKLAQIKIADKASERMLAKWADPEFRESMLLARQEARKQGSGFKIILVRLAANNAKELP